MVYRRAIGIAYVEEHERAYTLDVALNILVGKVGSNLVHHDDIALVRAEPWVIRHTTPMEGEKRELEDRRPQVVAGARVSVELEGDGMVVRSALFAVGTEQAGWTDDG